MNPAHSLNLNGELALSSSFRDPSGFLFTRDGQLLRQINNSYKADYEFFISSGLCEELQKKRLLIPHSEVVGAVGPSHDSFKVIAPTVIPFISYPNEWCFSTLKDAALLTLDLQDAAFKHGMMLKDASAYNVQMFNGRPIFIDTLSFSKYTAGSPWIAYRQFCQHFLAPLALMAYFDARLIRLSQLFIDGVPLDIASVLLPWRTKFKLGLAIHIHAHAKSQKRYADSANSGAVPSTKAKLSSTGLLGITDSLRSTIKSLEWKPEGTEWGDYYQQTNYTESSMQQKKQLVAEFLSCVKPGKVWDLGANTGVFSEVAAASGAHVVAFDIDPAAVEKNYRLHRKSESRIVPLVLDLTNPTPAFGWGHSERMSLSQRGPVDLAMALALVHHLAIGNNVPLEKVALFFSEICRYLVIEFVPKSDSQVKRLLASREDVFPNYTQTGFEQAFSQFFKIERHTAIAGTERTLYLMQVNQ